MEYRTALEQTVVESFSGMAFVDAVPTQPGETVILQGVESAQGPLRVVLEHRERDSWDRPRAGRG